jgi:GTP pyrophosphokinase
MDNNKTNSLRYIILAPYIQVASALIGKSRKIGGNQFRHTWATTGILIDYKIVVPAILKAGLLHDLKEDAPELYFPDQIRNIDVDGPRVVELIEELSIRPGEPKHEYLLRVMTTGSYEAKIIKLADRISNLTDIQLGTFDVNKLNKTLAETEKYILPYAKDVNENMFYEIQDFIHRQTKYAHKTIELVVNKVMENVVDRIQDLDVAFEKKICDKCGTLVNKIEKLFSNPKENTEDNMKIVSQNIEELGLLMQQTLLEIIKDNDLSPDFLTTKIQNQSY